MCRPIRCDVCGKTTWAGCGQHIDQVKAQVPPSQWCDGNHTAAEKSTHQPLRRRFEMRR
ncbi:hypothetical protein HMPREF1485_00680 [Propionibacterium sp. HGH0353]|nr:hypothetical protein HMPREF1485_00680 [Propionibacterium sp. HGH0353]